ncbi:MAG: CDP-alcohol phosphatidyltransferase family protein [Rhodospirillaceae bacterium]|nr:CDP-alcohol phosphatidyltransferase family protein [Rhodospirillaceae bacterium]
MKRTAAAWAAIGALGVVLAATAVARASPLGAIFVAGAVGGYTLGGAWVLRHIRTGHPHARFGAANTVTLMRMALAALSVGIMLDAVVVQGPVPDGLAWGAFAIAALGLALDGIDGPLARCQNLESAFGARFDMEVDAALILALSVLAWAWGKCGAWVIVGGLLRYAFVAAGTVWPVLTGPLAPSFRRKVAAVVQGATLTALAAPVITPPLSSVAAAAALALLVYSFAVDVFRLLRSRRASYSRPA